MRPKLQRRIKYRGVPIDYVLEDWHHPYAVDYGDEENPGMLSDRTGVMYPVYVTAKNLSDKDVSLFGLSDEYLTEGGEPESVRNIHSRRWVRQHPEEYERNRLMEVLLNEPLKIVPIEYNAAMWALAGAGLYNQLKTFRLLGALENVPMGYTGVPAKYVPKFNRFSGRIYTTNDVGLARQYSKGDFGRANIPGGKVYKIYDTQYGKDIVNIPEPPKDYAYHWINIPYNINKNGSISKVKVLGLLDEGDSYVPNSALNGSGFTTPVSNKAGIYANTQGNSVDYLTGAAEYAGKRGVRVPWVVDGAYELGEEIYHPALIETVYTPNTEGLIKAPLDENILQTRLRGANYFSSSSLPFTNMVINNNE